MNETAPIETSSAVESAPMDTAPSFNMEASAPATTESNSVSFDSYLSSLTDADREMFQKNGVDSFEKQSKWISNMNSMIGKKGLIKPGEGASEQEIANYRESLLNELGRPESAEYEFSLPENIPDEYVSEDYIDGVAQWAYENGVSNEAFQKLTDMMYTAYGQTIEQFTSKITEMADYIKKNTGSDQFDTGGNTPPSNSPHDLSKQAAAMLSDINEARSQNNWKEVERLQQERRELLVRAAQ